MFLRKKKILNSAKKVKCHVTNHFSCRRSYFNLRNNTMHIFKAILSQIQQFFADFHITFKILFRFALTLWNQQGLVCICIYSVTYIQSPPPPFGSKIYMYESLKTVTLIILLVMLTCLIAPDSKLEWNKIMLRLLKLYVGHFIPQTRSFQLQIVFPIFTFTYL